MEYTDDHLSRIKDDAAYLIDEAEALSYVIDSVPTADKAQGIKSIAEMIALIDHAQQSYYRPACERLYSVPEVNEKLTDFNATFDAGMYETDDTGKLLSHISRNRTGFLNFINELQNDELRHTGTVNGEEVSIAGLLEEMVTFERRQLREVAERILAIDKNINKSQKPG